MSKNNKSSWGCQFLNGIEFSCRFRNIELPELPEFPQLSNCINEEYNFSVENRVINVFNESFDIDKKEKELQKSKVSKKVNNNDMSSSFMVSNEILVPQPAQENSKPVVIKQNVDLRDFDKVEDPFDNAELNTIDVFAQLRDVLLSEKLTSSNELEKSEHQEDNNQSLKSVREISFPCLSLCDSDINGYSSDNGLAVSYHVTDKKSHTPPINGSVISHTTSHLQSTITSTQKPHKTSHVYDKDDSNNPYSTLSVADKVLVDSLTPMGFTQPRVARVVKFVGTDERRTVDFLCAQDVLVERGFELKEAEQALLIWQGSPEQAQQYLTLKKDLLDFGFLEEDILLAARACNLDRVAIIKRLQEES